MDYFIDDVLIASFFSVEFGRVVSTGFSVALLAVNLLMRALNRKNHPPAALYHFTTYGRMMSILGTGCVRGGGIMALYSQLPIKNIVTEAL
ncbi:hypothetical protein NA256_22920 [Salmonella sp. NW805]|uniref:hypothetical protein n=1 Tax=unclassified Salmonella TaxID=2614656 RepID=UPI003F443F12|nr:hypothetical protein [Salmonella enterica]HBM0507491.1 hypothetical protein [Salmonella enterica]